MVVDYAAYVLKNLRNYQNSKNLPGLCGDFANWAGDVGELDDMGYMGDLVIKAYSKLVPKEAYPFGGYNLYHRERSYGRLYYNEARLDFLRRLSKLHDTFVDDFGNLRQKDVETLAGDFHEYH